jgi:hypothetical protein
LIEAGGTAGAEIVVETIAVACAQLDHSIFGARGETAIAFEARTARKASLRLVHGLGLRQAVDYFIEGRNAMAE